MTFKELIEKNYPKYFYLKREIKNKFDIDVDGLKLSDILELNHHHPMLVQLIEEYLEVYETIMKDFVEDLK